MTFYVGQQVVRVGGNASNGDEWAVEIARKHGYSYPNVGDICTVKTINHWPTRTLITLEEHDNSHLIPLIGCKHEPGFSARCFRPVVKTDISVFTALLNPTEHEKEIA